MPSQLWSQDVFSRGELSPYMRARVSVNQYYQGLRTAKNVLTYPQGAAGKRFGTLYNAVLNAGVTNYDQIFFQTFQYLNECVYQILFRPLAIDIYLEGILIATVVTTLDQTDVWNLDYTVIDNRFRVSGEGFRPKDLIRSASTANVLISITANEFDLTTPVTSGLIVPVRITTSGTLPTTVPQVKSGVTYFAKYTSTTTAKLYATSKDAADDVNEFTLSSLGTGTNNIVPQNNWAFSNVTFKNYPVYDFNGGYDTYTFTPSATSGAAVTLTSSTAVFHDYHVGGAYVGGGGIGRITAVPAGPYPVTTCTIAVAQPFDSTAAISGRLSLLAEPAWSDTRGWPKKCSSYQSRAIFANTASLPNGFWASAINDYADYNDLEDDDDDAISWYPTSDEVNYINFIVPYRSITVHTNSGVYSSPLSFETAITPKNFSLQLQDSTPAQRLQPKAIDNQIIIVSGNDVHSMLWDGINNAYTSTIISVLNEQLIDDPVDECAFVDLRRAGSRYVFIVNSDGTMAMYQTLLAEDVSGWTPVVMEQSYGNAYIRQVASSFDGRCWFVVEREIAEASAGINITAHTSSTLEASGSAFDTETPTAVKFTTSGSLPTSTPQIETGVYYWVIGTTVNDFKVYPTQNDALNDVNGIVFSATGTNSQVVPWRLATKFYLEELTFETRLDCATKYIGSATDTVTGQSRFNAQEVKMVGDGFGFSAEGNNNEIVFEAHGDLVEVEEAYIGFPIRYEVEPFPLAIPMAGTHFSTTLPHPKHIRKVYFMFNDTIGGTINGVPIALTRFNEVQIGDPPEPMFGIFEIALMKGWDDFDNPSFTIEHDEPFDIQLLGVFYVVDI